MTGPDRGFDDEIRSALRYERGGADLVVESGIWARHAGAATFPVFSVLSHFCSAPLNSFR